MLFQLLLIPYNIYNSFHHMFSLYDCLLFLHNSVFLINNFLTIYIPAAPDTNLQQLAAEAAGSMSSFIESGSLVNSLNLSPNSACNTLGMRFTVFENVSEASGSIQLINVANNKLSDSGLFSLGGPLVPFNDFFIIISKIPLVSNFFPLIIENAIDRYISLGDCSPYQLLANNRDLYLVQAELSPSFYVSSEPQSFYSKALETVYSWFGKDMNHGFTHYVPLFDFSSREAYLNAFFLNDPTGALTREFKLVFKFLNDYFSFDEYLDSDFLPSFNYWDGSGLELHFLKYDKGDGSMSFLGKVHYFHVWSSNFLFFFALLLLVTLHFFYAIFNYINFSVKQVNVREASTAFSKNFRQKIFRPSLFFLKRSRPRFILFLVLGTVFAFFYLTYPYGDTITHVFNSYVPSNDTYAPFIRERVVISDYADYFSMRQFWENMGKVKKYNGIFSPLFLLQTFILFIGFLSYPSLKIYISRLGSSIELQFLYYVILLVAISIFLLVSLFNVFIAIEVLSFCSYGVLLIVKDRESAGGVIKYYIFSVLASSFLLFGFFLFFAKYGTLDAYMVWFGLWAAYASSPLVYAVAEQAPVELACYKSLEIMENIIRPGTEVIWNDLSNSARNSNFFKYSTEYASSFYSLPKTGELGFSTSPNMSVAKSYNCMGTYLNAVQNFSNNPFHNGISILGSSSPLGDLTRFTKNFKQGFRLGSNSTLLKEISGFASENLRKTLALYQETRWASVYFSIINDSLWGSLLNLFSRRDYILDIITEVAKHERLNFGDYIADSLNSIVRGVNSYDPAGHDREYGTLVSRLQLVFRYITRKSGAESYFDSFLGGIRSRFNVENPLPKVREGPPLFSEPVERLFNFIGSFVSNFVKHEVYISREYAITRMRANEVSFLNIWVDAATLTNFMLNLEDNLLSFSKKSFTLPNGAVIRKDIFFDKMRLVLNAYLLRLNERILLSDNNPNILGLRQGRDFSKITDIDVTTIIFPVISTYDAVPPGLVESGLNPAGWSKGEYYSFDASLADGRGSMAQMGGDTSVLFTEKAVKTFINQFSSYNPCLHPQFESVLVNTLQEVIVSSTSRQSDVNKALLVMFLRHFPKGNFLPFLSKLDTIDFRDMNFTQNHYKQVNNFYLGYRGDVFYKRYVYKKLMGYIQTCLLPDALKEWGVFPKSLYLGNFNKNLSVLYKQELLNINRYHSYVYRYHVSDFTPKASAKARTLFLLSYLMEPALSVLTKVGSFSNNGPTLGVNFRLIDFLVKSVYNAGYYVSATPVPVFGNYISGDLFFKSLLGLPNHTLNYFSECSRHFYALCLNLNIFDIKYASSLNGDAGEFASGGNRKYHTILHDEEIEVPYFLLWSLIEAYNQTDFVHHLPGLELVVKHFDNYLLFAWRKHIALCKSRGLLMTPEINSTLRPLMSFNSLMPFIEHLRWETPYIPGPVFEKFTVFTLAHTFFKNFSDDVPRFLFSELVGPVFGGLNQPVVERNLSVDLDEALLLECWTKSFQAHFHLWDLGNLATFLHKVEKDSILNFESLNSGGCLVGSCKCSGSVVHLSRSLASYVHHNQPTPISFSFSKFLDLYTGTFPTSIIVKEPLGNHRFNYTTCSNLLFSFFFYYKGVPMHNPSHKGAATLHVTKLVGLSADSTFADFAKYLYIYNFEVIKFVDVDNWGVLMDYRAHSKINMYTYYSFINSIPLELSYFSAKTFCLFLTYVPKTITLHNLIMANYDKVFLREFVCFRSNLFYSKPCHFFQQGSESFLVYENCSTRAINAKINEFSFFFLRNYFYELSIRSNFYYFVQHLRNLQDINPKKFELVKNAIASNTRYSSNSNYSPHSYLLAGTSKAVASNYAKLHNYYNVITNIKFDFTRVYTSYSRYCSKITGLYSTYRSRMRENPTVMDLIYSKGAGPSMVPQAGQKPVNMLSLLEGYDILCLGQGFGADSYLHSSVLFEPNNMLFGFVPYVVGAHLDGLLGDRLIFSVDKIINVLLKLKYAFIYGEDSLVQGPTPTRLNVSPLSHVSVAPLFSSDLDHLVMHSSLSSAVSVSSGLDRDSHTHTGQRGTGWSSLFFSNTVDPCLDFFGVLTGKNVSREEAFDQYRKPGGPYDVFFYVLEFERLFFLLNGTGCGVLLDDLFYCVQNANTLDPYFFKSTKPLFPNPESGMNPAGYISLTGCNHIKSFWVNYRLANIFPDLFSYETKYFFTFYAPVNFNFIRYFFVEGNMCILSLYDLLNCRRFFTELSDPKYLLENIAPYSTQVNTGGTFLGTANPTSPYSSNLFYSLANWFQQEVLFLTKYKRVSTVRLEEDGNRLGKGERYGDAENALAESRQTAESFFYKFYHQVVSYDGMAGLMFGVNLPSNKYLSEYKCYLDAEELENSLFYINAVMAIELITPPERRVRDKYGWASIHYLSFDSPDFYSTSWQLFDIPYYRTGEPLDISYSSNLHHFSPIKSANSDVEAPIFGACAEEVADNETFWVPDVSLGTPSEFSDLYFGGLALRAGIELGVSDEHGVLNSLRPLDNLTALSSQLYTRDVRFSEPFFSLEELDDDDIDEHRAYGMLLDVEEDDDVDADALVRPEYSVFDLGDDSDLHFLYEEEEGVYDMFTTYAFDFLPFNLFVATLLRKISGEDFEYNSAVIRPIFESMLARKNPAFERYFLNSYLSRIFASKYVFSRLPLFGVTLYEVAVRSSAEDGCVHQFEFDAFAGHSNKVFFRGRSSLPINYINGITSDTIASFFFSKDFTPLEHSLENSLLLARERAGIHHKHLLLSRRQSLGSLKSSLFYGSYIFSDKFFNQNSMFSSPYFGYTSVTYNRSITFLAVDSVFSYYFSRQRILSEGIHSLFNSGFAQFLQGLNADFTNSSFNLLIHSLFSPILCVANLFFARGVFLFGVLNQDLINNLHERCVAFDAALTWGSFDVTSLADYELLHRNEKTLLCLCFLLDFGFSLLLISLECFIVLLNFFSLFLFSPTYSSFLFMGASAPDKIFTNFYFHYFNCVVLPDNASFLSQKYVHKNIIYLKLLEQGRGFFIQAHDSAAFSCTNVGVINNFLLGYFNMPLHHDHVFLQQLAKEFLSFCSNSLEPFFYGRGEGIAKNFLFFFSDIIAVSFYSGFFIQKFSVVFDLVSAKFVDYNAYGCLLRYLSLERLTEFGILDAYLSSLKLLRSIVADRVVLSDTSLGFLCEIQAEPIGSSLPIFLRSGFALGDLNEELNLRGQRSFAVALYSFFFRLFSLSLTDGVVGAQLQKLFKYHSFDLSRFSKRDLNLTLFHTDVVCTKHLVLSSGRELFFCFKNGFTVSEINLVLSQCNFSTVELEEVYACLSYDSSWFFKLYEGFLFDLSPRLFYNQSNRLLFLQGIIHEFGGIYSVIKQVQPFYTSFTFFFDSPWEYMLLALYDNLESLALHSQERARVLFSYFHILLGYNVSILYERSLMPMVPCCQGTKNPHNQSKIFAGIVATLLNFHSFIKFMFTGILHHTGSGWGYTRSDYIGWYSAFCYFIDLDNLCRIFNECIRGYVVSPFNFFVILEGYFSQVGVRLLSSNYLLFGSFSSRGLCVTVFYYVHSALHFLILEVGPRLRFTLAFLESLLSPTKYTFGSIGKWVVVSGKSGQWCSTFTSQPVSQLWERTLAFEDRYTTTNPKLHFLNKFEVPYTKFFFSRLGGISLKFYDCYFNYPDIASPLFIQTSSDPAFTRVFSRYFMRLNISSMLFYKKPMHMHSRLVSFLLDYKLEMLGRSSLYPLLHFKHSCFTPYLPNFHYPGYASFFASHFLEYSEGCDVGRALVTLSRQEMLLLGSKLQDSLVTDDFYYKFLTVFDRGFHRRGPLGGLGKRRNNLRDASSPRLLRGHKKLQQGDFWIDSSLRLKKRMHKLFKKSRIRSSLLVHENYFSEALDDETFYRYFDICGPEYFALIHQKARGLRFLFYKYYDYYHKKEYFGNCLETSLLQSEWLQAKHRFIRVLATSLRLDTAKGLRADYFNQSNLYLQDTMPNENKELCALNRRLLDSYSFAFYPSNSFTIPLLKSFVALSQKMPTYSSVSMSYFFGYSPYFLVTRSNLNLYGLGCSFLSSSERCSLFRYGQFYSFCLKFVSLCVFDIKYFWCYEPLATTRFLFYVSLMPTFNFMASPAQGSKFSQDILLYCGLREYAFQCFLQYVKTQLVNTISNKRAFSIDKEPYNNLDDSYFMPKQFFYPMLPYLQVVLPPKHVVNEVFLKVLVPHNIVSDRRQNFNLYLIPLVCAEICHPVRILMNLTPVLSSFFNPIFYRPLIGSFSNFVFNRISLGDDSRSVLGGMRARGFSRKGPIGAGMFVADTTPSTASFEANSMPSESTAGVKPGNTKGDNPWVYHYMLFESKKGTKGSWKAQKKNFLKYFDSIRRPLSLEVSAPNTPGFVSFKWANADVHSSTRAILGPSILEFLRKNPVLSVSWDDTVEVRRTKPSFKKNAMVTKVFQREVKLLCQFRPYVFKRFTEHYSYAPFLKHVARGQEGLPPFFNNEPFASEMFSRTAKGLTTLTTRLSFDAYVSKFKYSNSKISKQYYRTLVNLSHWASYLFATMNSTGRLFFDDKLNLLGRAVARRVNLLPKDEVVERDIALRNFINRLIISRSVTMARRANFLTDFSMDYTLFLESWLRHHQGVLDTPMFFFAYGTPYHRSYKLSFLDLLHKIPQVTFCEAKYTPGITYLWSYFATDELLIQEDSYFHLYLNYPEIFYRSLDIDLYLMSVYRDENLGKFRQNNCSQFPSSTFFSRMLVCYGGTGALSNSLSFFRFFLANSLDTSSKQSINYKLGSCSYFSYFTINGYTHLQLLGLYFSQSLFYKLMNFEYNNSYSPGLSEYFSSKSLHHLYCVNWCGCYICKLPVNFLVQHGMLYRISRLSIVSRGTPFLYYSVIHNSDNGTCINRQVYVLLRLLDLAERIFTPFSPAKMCSPLFLGVLHCRSGQLTVVNDYLDFCFKDIRFFINTWHSSGLTSVPYGIILNFAKYVKSGLFYDYYPIYPFSEVVTPAFRDLAFKQGEMPLSAHLLSHPSRFDKEAELDYVSSNENFINLLEDRIQQARLGAYARAKIAQEDCGPLSSN